MTGFLLALAVLSLWGALTTVGDLARDGYRAVPVRYL